TKRKHFHVADGSSEWRYSIPGPLVAKRAQTKDSLELEDFNPLLQWYLHSPKSAPDRDRGSLKAYVLEDADYPATVWVDSSLRVREVESGDIGFQRFATIEWDSDLPANCFIPAPPPDAQVVEPAQYL